MGIQTSFLTLRQNLIGKRPIVTTIGRFVWFKGKICVIIHIFPKNEPIGEDFGNHITLYINITYKGKLFI